MSEKHPEEHIPDAFAHAMIPPAPQPDEPPPERPAREDATPGDAEPHAELAVESGPVVSRLEEIFPLVWLGMLTVVSVVGIYSAVSRLP